MLRKLILVTGCLFLLAGVARSNEVVIPDYPLGIAGSSAEEFFKPYYPALQLLVDSLDQYPDAFLLVTGCADGEQYKLDNDALNPALALGRAHSLRYRLIRDFGVDPERILLKTVDVKEIGPEYRYASATITWPEEEEAPVVVQQAPQVINEITQVIDSTEFINESFTLYLGAGITSSPNGGIPYVDGMLSWKDKLFLELMLGHSFWKDTYQHKRDDLDTKRRLAGGNLVYYPWDDIRIGFVGGWIRFEEVAQDYYEYVRLSEGLVLGVRVTPLDYLSITAALNPSKHRFVDQATSETRNDQFLVSASLHFALGGKK